MLAMRLWITALLLLRGTWAWGAFGHRTVAELAARQIANGTQAMLTQLLPKGQNISDVAPWADIVRGKYPHTAGWHFIDIANCHLDYANDCPKNSSCIIAQIQNQTNILTDPTTTHNITEALMFLIHFLGDIHQPFHTEATLRGGNEIPVWYNGTAPNGTCGDTTEIIPNLHNSWDDFIIYSLNGFSTKGPGCQMAAAAARWGQQLPTTPADQTWTGNCQSLDDSVPCATNWAVETNSCICTDSLLQDCDWYTAANDLYLSTYYGIASKVATNRITWAGGRLAAWLDAIAAKRASESFKMLNGHVMNPQSEL